MSTTNNTELSEIAEIVLRDFHGIYMDMNSQGFNQKINNDANLKLVANKMECPLLSYNNVGTYNHSGISPSVTVGTQGLWFSCVLLVNNNNALKIIDYILSNTIENGSKNDTEPAFFINLMVTADAKNGTRIPAGTTEVFGIKKIRCCIFTLNGEMVAYLCFEHNKFTHKIKMEKGNQNIEIVCIDNKKK